MAYNKEYRELAKIYVAFLRETTYCQVCGRQPIEWHSETHKSNGNKRIAHLVALGFPLKVIADEIKICEAMCRKCHMASDGRTEKLRESCPIKKGNIIVGELPCIVCGTLSRPRWREKCKQCYDAIHRPDRRRIGK